MKCPTPEKRGYASQRELIAAAIGSSRTFGKAVRTYRCTCGRWHVTTRTTRRAVLDVMTEEANALGMLDPTSQDVGTT